MGAAGAEGSQDVSKKTYDTFLQDTTEISKPPVSQQATQT
jgi:hypothetical protein